MFLHGYMVWRRVRFHYGIERVEWVRRATGCGRSLLTDSGSSSGLNTQLTKRQTTIRWSLASLVMMRAGLKVFRLCRLAPARGCFNPRSNGALLLLNCPKCQ
jgi:hypothetical protein